MVLLYCYFVLGDSVWLIDVVVEVVVIFVGVVGFVYILVLLCCGQQDLCFWVFGDGIIWWISLLFIGLVIVWISCVGCDVVCCVVWGSGVEEFVDMVFVMLGVVDDVSDFVLLYLVVVVVYCWLLNLCLGCIGQVLEVLILVVIEQWVFGVDVFWLWWLLVFKYGMQVFGLVLFGMWVLLLVEVWCYILFWEFYCVNVDLGWVCVVVGCVQWVVLLEWLVLLFVVWVVEVLILLFGVGVWIVVEII